MRNLKEDTDDKLVKLAKRVRRWWAWEENMDTRSMDSVEDFADGIKEDPQGMIDNIQDWVDNFDEDDELDEFDTKLMKEAKKCIGLIQDYMSKKENLKEDRIIDPEEYADYGRDEDAEDCIFHLNSFYDSRMRGLEDYLETNDPVEAEDWAWEHLNKGGTIQFENWKSGKSVILRPDELLDDYADYASGAFEDAVNDSGVLEEDMGKEIKRYSDVYSDERRNQGWWYFTTHGVQPGSVPKGVNILEVRDTPNGTYFRADAILNTSELEYYDIKERVPKQEESLKESSGKVYVVKTLQDYPYNGWVELMDKVDKNGEGEKHRFTDRDEVRKYAQELADQGYSNWQGYPSAEKKPANTKINIRESLNKYDLRTDNKYDLRNLYDACIMTDKEKRIIAEMISKNARANVLYEALMKKFEGKELKEALDGLRFSSDDLKRKAQVLYDNGFITYNQLIWGGVSEKDIDKLYSDNFDDNGKQRRKSKYKKSRYKKESLKESTDGKFKFNSGDIAYTPIGRDIYIPVTIKDAWFGTEYGLTGNFYSYTYRDGSLCSSCPEQFLLTRDEVQKNGSRLIGESLKESADDGLLSSCKEKYRRLIDIADSAGDFSSIKEVITAMFNEVGGKVYFEEVSRRYVSFSGSVKGHSLWNSVSLEYEQADLHRLAEDLTMAFYRTNGGQGYNTYTLMNAIHSLMGAEVGTDENESLKEEYGEFKDEPYMEEIARMARQGYYHGEVDGVEWEITFNGYSGSDFNSLSFLEYMLDTVSYPISDGHLRYYDLDCYISDFNDEYDSARDDLKEIFQVEDGDLDGANGGLEFWCDYDVDFDIEEWERNQLDDDEDEGEYEDEDDYDESLKEGVNDRLRQIAEPLANALDELTDRDDGFYITYSIGMDDNGAVTGGVDFELFKSSRTEEEAKAEIERVFDENGFELDRRFKTNPGKTLFGRTHYQIIEKDK